MSDLVQAEESHELEQRISRLEVDAAFLLININQQTEEPEEAVASVCDQLSLVAFLGDKLDRLEGQISLLLSLAQAISNESQQPPPIPQFLLLRDELRDEVHQLRGQISLLLTPPASNTPPYKPTDQSHSSPSASPPTARSRAKCEKRRRSFKSRTRPMPHENATRQRRLTARGPATK